MAKLAIWIFKENAPEVKHIFSWSLPWAGIEIVIGNFISPMNIWINFSHSLVSGTNLAAVQHFTFLLNLNINGTKLRRRSINEALSNNDKYSPLTGPWNVSSKLIDLYSDSWRFQPNKRWISALNTDLYSFLKFVTSKFKIDKVPICFTLNLKNEEERWKSKCSWKITRWIPS